MTAAAPTTAAAMRRDQPPAEAGDGDRQARQGGTAGSAMPRAAERRGEKKRRGEPGAKSDEDELCIIVAVPPFERLGAGSGQPSPQPESRRVAIGSSAMVHRDCRFAVRSLYLIT